MWSQVTLAKCAKNTCDSAAIGSIGVSDIRDVMAERFHRRSIRLPGYDYTRAGAYYVTVCTHQRAHAFGQVANGVMRNSAMGDIVKRCWDAIPQHMPMVVCDAFVAMPNHVHGIVVIRARLAPPASTARPDARARHDAPRPDPHKPPGIPRGALGQIVASYKSAVSRIAYRDGVLPRGTRVWQRNYWDDIIRGDGAYERIAQYIRDNPANWRTDDFHG